MSFTQTNICVPNTRLGGTYFSLSQSSYLHVSCLNASVTHKLERYKALPRLAYSPSKCRRCAPICLFGGKGNSKNENEAFSWDSLKKAMGGLGQKQTMQDLLRDQMREREFDGNGGDGDPPGGGGDGSGGAEDEGFPGILDELLQVVLATIGFIFVYIYMIRGAELTRLARDYIKYLIWGSTSVRLRKAMYKWRRFYESIIRKEEVREDWLERAIVATPTWWHKPRTLARLMRSRWFLSDWEHRCPQNSRLGAGSIEQMYVGLPIQQCNMLHEILVRCCQYAPLNAHITIFEQRVEFRYNALKSSAEEELHTECSLSPLKLHLYGKA